MNEPIFSVLTGKGSECCGNMTVSGLDSKGFLSNANGCYTSSGGANWVRDPGTGTEYYAAYMSDCTTLIIYEIMNFSAQVNIILPAATENCCAVTGTHQGVGISCGC